ncbi:MAG: hypothetical protein R6X34_29885, partial [Chloroflexota bacterium]
NRSGGPHRGAGSPAPEASAAEERRLTSVNRSAASAIFIDADGVVQEVIVGIVNQAVLEDRVEGMKKAK